MTELKRLHRLKAERDRRLQVSPELTRRVADPADRAALRDPVALAAHLDPLYKIRAHVQVIGRELAAVERGEVTRLSVDMPPQCGKTVTTVVWGVFWWLAKHPTAQVMVVCYGDSLAVKRGRAVRKLIIEHGGRFGLHLDPSSHAAHDWSLTTGGSMRCFGIRSGITGNPADCVVGETRIFTRSGSMQIADFFRLQKHPQVLSWNHETRRAEWRDVEGVRKITERKVVEVATRSGRTVRCTPEHRIFVVGRGYVPARSLQAGDRLIYAMGDSDMRTLPPTVHPSPLRDPESTAKRLAHHPLLGRLSAGIQDGAGVGDGATMPNMPWPHPRRPRTEGEGILLAPMPTVGIPHRGRLFEMWKEVSKAELRGGQAEAAGGRTSVLLAEVHGGTVRREGGDLLRGMRGCDRTRERAPLLLPRMQDRWYPEAAPELQAGPHQTVPAVRRRLHGEEFASGFLWQAMRQCQPLGKDDRGGQLAVSGRNELRETIPGDAPANTTTRRRQVPGVPETQPAGPDRAPRRVQMEVKPRDPSSERSALGQPAREPDRSLFAVPRRTSHVGYDTVSMVRELHNDGHDVYDLQVEGNRNFFADEVLVHNCVWIDDPHRSRKEADSATIRTDVHNAYSGDIQSRLAPDAPIILVATRWHDDDLTGHLWSTEGRESEGGLWRVIHMPALCTDPVADPLGRSAGDPLPHPKVEEGDVARLLRHWEGRRRSSTVRDWASLYQGDPRPAEGALLSREVLRERRCYQHGSPAGPCCDEVKFAAVAVDPSGGGRNTAGIIGGYLGTDDRLYLTHDRTDVLPSDQWAREACILAAETDADRVCIERNFGGDLARLAVRTAWDALSREAQRDGYVWRRAQPGEQGEKRAGKDGRWLKTPGVIFQRLCPRIVEVSAKKGKLLRAEPIAQQVTEDRIRFARALPETEDEWATWQAGSSDSPGRIDASVYLAYELLPVPQSGESTVTGAQALAGANLLPWGH